MACLRRIAVMLTAAGLLVVLSLFRAGTALPQETSGETVSVGGVYLSTDARLERVAATFARCVQDHEWDAAAHAVYMLLDAPPEILLPMGKREEGKPRRVWAGARAVGRRLLAGSPAEVARSFTRFYGTAARGLLPGGRKAKDLNPPVEAEVSGDWRLFRGNVSRSGQAPGGLPLLDKPSWRRSTIMDKSDDIGEVDRGPEAKHWLDVALQRQATLPNLPALSGFFPVAAANRLFYRTYVGVSAVLLNDQRDAQGKVLARAGSIDWKSYDLDGSLGIMLNDSNLKPTLDQWLVQYTASAGFISLLYENSAVGTVATDHRLVYAVDDLAVPAPPNVMTAMGFNLGAGPKKVKPLIQQNVLYAFEKVKPLIQQNVLYAFEIETGRLKWRLGQASEDRDKKESDYADTHFLGTPLSVGGKLYVLTEAKNGNLRLLRIDPMKYGDPTTKREPVVLARQDLTSVQPKYRITNDFVRRLHSVHLAYAADTMLVPTNAGVLVAVDLRTDTVSWVYAYLEEKPPPLPMEPKPPSVGFLTRAGATPHPGGSLGEWFASTPVIQGDRVLFTAPDDASLHCLHLADGTPLWHTRRSDDDLYLAGVFGGKVLLVGKRACRALDLASGKELWRLETGVPSGLGVGDGRTYYLPLRAAAPSKMPGVCAIDVNEGRLVRQTSSRNGETPGNLVFHGGQLFSQTATSVTAYPLAKERTK